jgi:hypothetical protein
MQKIPFYKHNYYTENYIHKLDYEIGGIEANSEIEELTTTIILMMP